MKSPLRKEMSLLTEPEKTPRSHPGPAPAPGLTGPPGWQTLQPPSAEHVGFYVELHASTQQPENR